MRAATPTAAAELACMDVSSLKNQLASLHNKLTRQIEFSINQLAQKLDFLARRLVSPLQQLENKANQLKQLQNRFALAMQQQLQAHQQHLLRLKNSVEQLNPQAVLARGYALVQTEKGEVVRSTSQIKLTDMVQIRFAEGQAGAEIKLIEK